MEDLEIFTTVHKIPESIVEGLWNGDVVETDKEHLLLVVNAVSSNDLEEMQSYLQKKEETNTSQENLRGLVILLHAIIERGGEMAYLAAKVLLFFHHHHHYKCSPSSLMW